MLSTPTTGKIKKKSGELKNPLLLERMAALCMFVPISGWKFDIPSLIFILTTEGGEG